MEHGCPVRVGYRGLGERALINANFKLAILESRERCLISALRRREESRSFTLNPWAAFRSSWSMLPT
jgi:hypothetical protein